MVLRAPPLAAWTLAVAVYSHYKKIARPREIHVVPELPKDEAKMDMPLRDVLDEGAGLRSENTFPVLATDDDFAWDVRERLYDKYPAAVVGSLAMLGSERAWKMRQRWLDRSNGQLGQSYETARVGAKAVQRGLITAEQAVKAL